MEKRTYPDILKIIAEELTAQNDKTDAAIAKAEKSENRSLWALLIGIASLVMAATALLIVI